MRAGVGFFILNRPAAMQSGPPYSSEGLTQPQRQARTAAGYSPVRAGPPSPSRAALFFVVAFSAPAAAGKHVMITLQQVFASAYVSTCMNCTFASKKCKQAIACGAAMGDEMSVWEGRNGHECESMREQRAWR